MGLVYDTMFTKWRETMNINYKWGFYVDNKLVLMEACLNTDFEYYKKIKELLKVYKLKDFSFVRIGGSHTDGHYLMVDSFKKKQIAYSFGINNDVSWDSDMVDRGYQVFMYDHTIKGLPMHKDGFNYFKQGIAGESKPSESLDTLENYMKINGHAGKTGMILKMDVEGAEWDFLETVPSRVLRQFDQIILEIHNLVRGCEDYEKQKRYTALKKLNETHRLVHLHGNNTGYQLQLKGATIPDVIEVTYVNKDKYKTQEVEVVSLPTALDKPNDPNREDICIENWNAPLKENPFEFEL